MSIVGVSPWENFSCICHISWKWIITCSYVHFSIWVELRKDKTNIKAGASDHQVLCLVFSGCLSRSDLILKVILRKKVES